MNIIQIPELLLPPPPPITLVTVTLLTETPFDCEMYIPKAVEPLDELAFFLLLFFHLAQINEIPALPNTGEATP
jgi:hypothetical protein